MEKEVMTPFEIVKDIVTQGADAPEMMQSNILLDAIYTNCKKAYQDDLRTLFDSTKSKLICERIIDESLRLRLSEEFINQLKSDFDNEYNSRS